MKKWALLWACLCWTGWARADSSGADFLVADIPARPAALAGAFAAYDDDSNAFLWNPAALAKLGQTSLSATHFSSVVDTSYDQASLGIPIDGWGGLGLSVQHSSTSNLDETDLAGNDLGSIPNGDWVLDFGYGVTVMTGLNLGLGLRGFDSRLAEFDSQGYAVDLGLQNDINRRLTFGLALDNLGQAQAYDQVSDPLPSLLRLGFRGLLVDSKEVLITAAAELDRPWNTSDPLLLALGAEYWYEGLVAFRVGYRFGVDNGNLSLGLGLKWIGLDFDYAYVSQGDLGQTHRFSISAELGTLYEKAERYLPSPDPPQRNTR